MSAPDGSLAANGPRVLVGGYTAEMAGHARGITTLSPGPDGSLVETGLFPLDSPTYLITHPHQPWVFAVTEGTPSKLTSARVEADGSLTALSSVGTGGDFGAHLALTPDAGHVVVAHYGSGSVASFEIGAEAELGERRDLRQFSGSGADPERQEGPHAHQVVFDGDVLLVADLGTDRVHRLRVGSDGTFSDAGAAIQLPPGTGPRHLVVVGEDHLVVVGELSAEVWLGVRTATGWRPAQSVPSSIAELADRIVPSAIRADGDTVFVANRVAGTISVFELDRAAHTLTRLQEFSCGGPGPRDLVLNGRQLWVANQSTDLITVFERGAWGPPRWAYEVSSPSPACIVPLGEPSAIA